MANRPAAIRQPRASAHKALDVAAFGAMLSGMRKSMVLVGVGVMSLVSMTGFAKGKDLVVKLKDAKGEDVGTVAIKPVASGVTLKLNLHGLAPGQHAIHFHQNAKCEGPDFKSAGPHFNPEGKKHGLESPEGSHAGDMLNFTADAKGIAKATITNKSVNLGDDSHSLFSNGGTALVVHAKPDDMKTDPAGNAGDRIACGVITK
jgi:superoxide dismutase, Cu-Zn family